MPCRYEPDRSIFYLDFGEMDNTVVRIHGPQSDAAEAWPKAVVQDQSGTGVDEECMRIALPTQSTPARRGVALSRPNLGRRLDPFITELNSLVA